MLSFLQEKEEGISKKYMARQRESTQERERGVHQGEFKLDSHGQVRIGDRKIVNRNRGKLMEERRQKSDRGE